MNLMIVIQTLSSRNVFEYNDSLRVMMEKNAKGSYQAGFNDGAMIASHPLDIVIGTDCKAQTYLYHDSSKIHQLVVRHVIKRFNTLL